MRQVLSWAPISIKTETNMTKPKLVISFSVKNVVWVRKPGPMDELAIRKAAPNPTPPNNLNLDGFDDNVVLFQLSVNGFRKFNRIFAIAMNTDRFCHNWNCFSGDGSNSVFF